MSDVSAPDPGRGSDNVDSTAADTASANVTETRPDTVKQSLMEQRDNLIDEISQIQEKINGLSSQIDAIDAKYDHVADGLAGAVNPNPVGALVGAISGVATSLSKEAAEIAPLEAEMRDQIDQREAKQWGLDMVNDMIDERP